jgi:hypothetical protein
MGVELIPIFKYGDPESEKNFKITVLTICDDMYI